MAYNFACQTVGGGCGVQEPLLYLLFELIISTLIKSVLWVKGLTRLFLSLIPNGYNFSQNKGRWETLELVCYWTGFSTGTKIEGRAVVYRISIKWKVFGLLFLLFLDLMLFGWSEIFSFRCWAFLIVGSKTIQWGFFIVAFLGLRIKGQWIAEELYLDGLLQISMVSWNSGSLDCQKAFQHLKCR